MESLQRLKDVRDFHVMRDGHVALGSPCGLICFEASRQSRLERTKTAARTRQQLGKERQRRRADVH